MMLQARTISLAVLGVVTAAGTIAGVISCGGGSSATTGGGTDGGTTGITGCADSLEIPSAPPGDPSDAGTLAGSSPVYANAFQGYSSWQQFNYSTDVDAGPHQAGELTAWINKVPPHGSTEFPTGTIIVKRIDSIPQTFAMEKRGDPGANAGGAEQWEFFELETECDGTTVNYIWRGFGPPVGEAYGGDPQACNGCHVDFKDNDYIGSAPLQLGNF
jgi:hypothetical protein